MLDMLTKLGFLTVPHGHFYEPKTELYGKFQERIELWARIMHRSAPWPTIVENDVEKLNPEFSEWMLGLPLGWVTADRYRLTRVKKLEQIGNGVSPAQAELALDDLLADEFIYDPLPEGETMSDTMPTEEEKKMLAEAGIDVQPDPQSNDLPSAHDLVAADLLARKNYGFRKYNTLLQPFNGRDSLQDAYEEFLDLGVYLRTRLFQGQTQQADAFLSGYIQCLLDSGKTETEVLEFVADVGVGNPFGKTTDEALHEKFDAAGYDDEQKVAAFRRFQADLDAIEDERAQATGDMHESMSAVAHQ